jgi:hypothetical protein
VTFIIREWTDPENFMQSGLRKATIKRGWSSERKQRVFAALQSAKCTVARRGANAATRKKKRPLYQDDPVEAAALCRSIRNHIVRMIAWQFPDSSRIDWIVMTRSGGTPDPAFHDTESELP